MVASGKDFEILKSVIESIPVLMVNVLLRVKSAAQVLLHYRPVQFSAIPLQVLPTVLGQFEVSRLSVTLPRTEAPATSDLRWNDHKLNSALPALHGHLGSEFSHRVLKTARLGARFLSGVGNHKWRPTDFAWLIHGMDSARCNQGVQA